MLLMKNQSSSLIVSNSSNSSIQNKNGRHNSSIIKDTVKSYSGRKIVPMRVVMQISATTLNIQHVISILTSSALRN